MQRRRWASLWLLALACLCLSASALDADTEALQAEDADRELLDQVLAESRTATTPPRPGISLYVRDAGVAFSSWLTELLDRFLPGFSRMADWFLAGSWGLLIAVLVVVLVLVGIALARRWWRHRPAPRAVPAPALPMEEEVPSWSPERWEEELKRRLAAGEVAAAVEALWWWLATRLLDRGADPSWTSRELLARAQRPDLRPWIQRLDRMIYGPESPPAEDVRLLFRDLREAA